MACCMTTSSHYQLTLVVLSFRRKIIQGINDDFCQLKLYGQYSLKSIWKTSISIWQISIQNIVRKMAATLSMCLYYNVALFMATINSTISIGSISRSRQYIFVSLSHLCNSPWVINLCNKILKPICLGLEYPMGTHSGETGDIHHTTIIQQPCCVSGSNWHYTSVIFVFKGNRIYHISALV